MGGLFGKLFSGKDARILMLGLDNAGKTSVQAYWELKFLKKILYLSLYLFLEILYRMKLQTQVTTLPTVGFNVETVKFKNFAFNIWVYISIHTNSSPLLLLNWCVLAIRVFRSILCNIIMYNFENLYCYMEKILRYFLIETLCSIYLNLVVFLIFWYILYLIWYARDVGKYYLSKLLRILNQYYFCQFWLCEHYEMN